MELVYSVGTPEGGACALVASYSYPPGKVTISALGTNAAKAAGQALRLYTPEGQIDDPLTIIRYLCDNSDACAALRGPEKNPADQAAIIQWLTFCASRGFQVSSASDLNEFNTALQQNTFLCGRAVSAADLVGMASLHDSMKKASTKELLLIKNVTRWYNHLQNLPGIKEQRVQDFPQVELPLTSAADLVQAADEMQKKQKDQRQGKQQKQHEDPKTSAEKKTEAMMKKGAVAAEKQKKKTVGVEKAEERPIDDPMRLDLRVGLVRKVWRHPEADKLYCEEIDFGPHGVRQIASGLVPFLPQEKFEGQKVVVLFNLKEKGLRGFNSHGMVMCANSEDKSAVELLQPPTNTPLGERVVVEGMQGEPDEVLSSKKGKDPLVALSPFLKTKDDCIAYFKELPLVTPQGPVRCASIKGGYIS